MRIERTVRAEEVPCFAAGVIPWGMKPGATLMFVYYFVHVNRPFSEVESSLVAQLNDLGPFADAAYREGEHLRDKAGVHRDHPVMAKTVQLVSGIPLRGDQQTTIPCAWEATGTPGLFPKLDADLIVAAVGPELCQIAIRGTYAPPLGPLGRALDRAVLHRVAEASVKSFVDRVAQLVGGDGVAVA
jgi:hypothetical protein